MANSTTKTYNFSLRQQDSYLGEDAEQIRDKRNKMCIRDRSRSGKKDQHLLSIQNMQ